MIQFNLLPDVKVSYLKAKKSKRLVVTAAIGISGLCILIVFLLFSTVQLGQKKHISDLTKDIKTEVGKIQSVDDLNKILTIQNQLKALPDLHQSKPLLSRIFTYINQTTPNNISINNFKIDMDTSTITVSGVADSISTVNTYADTLKFATYKTDDVTDGKPFTEITTTLSRDQRLASFDISMKFDPMIFNSTKDVVLVVPDQITTRSETEKPKALFEQPITEEQ